MTEHRRTPFSPPNRVPSIQFRRPWTISSSERAAESFFKHCGHPRSRWSKCPHPHKTRIPSAARKQMEKSVRPP
ncbi:hypothetical protein CG719_31915 [Streptomyces sp. CB01373]|nr:hypothetical protein CG719_31915 [Streptomyces sp. CB01373]